VSEPLFQSQLVPVCSAGLLQKSAHTAGSDLIKCSTLLHSNDRRDWIQWLTGAQLPLQLAEEGPVFEDTNVMMESAVAGQGIAMGAKPLVDEDLERGRLVLAHPHILPIKDTYHFVCVPELEEQDSVRAFRDWLRQEARAL
jgi:LysR family transcriptional regulator, glycine cleavage system transcriptional activator